MKTSSLCDLRRMDRADRSPLLRSFERHLRAANRAESTIASYLASLRQAERFLAARDVGLPDAQRADLEAFLADLLARWKPATAATRYKVLRLYYQWLEEEGEVTANPTAKLRPPIVPEQPVSVVPEDGLRRLLGTCAVRVRRTGIRAWYTGAGLDPAGGLTGWRGGTDKPREGIRLQPTSFSSLATVSASGAPRPSSHCPRADGPVDHQIGIRWTAPWLPLSQQQAKV